MPPATRPRGWPALTLPASCTPPPDATLEPSKELFRQYLEAHNTSDPDRLDELMAPDFAPHSRAATDVNSLEEFKANLRQAHEAFPDEHMESGVIVTERDEVAAHGTWTGTQQGAWGPFPAIEERAELKFFYLFCVDHGKLAELWTEWNNVGFLTQLGHFPPPEGT